MGKNKTDTKVKQVTHKNKTRKQTDHDMPLVVPAKDLSPECW